MATINGHKIIQVISEWKQVKGRMVDGGTRYLPPQRPPRGYKRVEAVVEIRGEKVTRHIDIPKA